MVQIKLATSRYALLALVCTMPLAVVPGLYAQSAAEKALLAKAQSLEASDHADMAVETWKQVLLADAKNKEALLGIARADMKLGKVEEAHRYLDRYRAAGGSATEITSVQGTTSQGTRGSRLQEASRLAEQGKSADAMVVYRSMYGSNPPDGDIALAYYDTEAGLPGSRAHAIAGLRGLSQKFSADSRYAITLGRVLTYDAKTRSEGISILRQYQESPAAQSALHQAEIWNKPPVQKTETANNAPSPETLAYHALNSGRLAEAKRLFQEILARQPNHASALAGMGFIAMKEQDFSSSVDYFIRARAAGERTLDGPLSTVQFLLKLTQAGKDLTAGNSAAATEGYRAAVAMNPHSVDALEGLGGALAQAGRNEEAADTFTRAVNLDAQRADSWRGLFFSTDGFWQCTSCSCHQRPDAGWH